MNVDFRIGKDLCEGNLWLSNEGKRPLDTVAANFSILLITAFLTGMFL
jgi:hypothetical protein